MESFKSFGCIIRKRNLLACICIWFIVAIVLTISLTVFKGSLIGIIYLIFFLTFVLLFQTSYSLWARSIKIYCLLLILYSTGVTILTYSYQYSGVNSFFKEFLSEQVLNDIGLIVRNNNPSLFEPFVPLILSLMLFLYLKIFHDDFNRFAYLAEEEDASLSLPLTGNQLVVGQTINDSTFIMLTESGQSDRNLAEPRQQPPTRTSRSSSMINPPSIHASKIDLRRSSKNTKIKKMINATFECLLRILETHFIKVVVFMIFRLAITDVCLINLPFLAIVIFALIYPTSAKCSCQTASWLIAFIVVTRNLSNLLTVRNFDIVNTCDTTAPLPLVNQTYSFPEYIGLNLNAGSPKNEIGNHVIVLLLITIYSFILIQYERRSVKNYELSFGVIFTGIGRREADNGFWDTIKYFANFGFYKFGIEITCLALVVAISNRLDSVAAIYGIILLLLGITTSKRTLASIWPAINLLVSLLIPIQYALRLGIPRVLCEPYPWETLSPDLKYWLFLSNYAAVQDVGLLLFDFLVLLSINRQAYVFKLMSLNTNSSIITNGQRHHNFCADQFRDKYLPNADEFTADDCFSNYTTQANYLKSIFFKSIYWITLAVVLVAGATNISLFSLGYLIGCFIFLWLGNDAYLVPLRRLIFYWNWFIFYATVVIFIKVPLQLAACSYHDYLLNHCYILQLLRVVCYRKINEPAINPTLAANTCAASIDKSYDELDILWDGLCLMFLLMQRIVFGSQYFAYLVQEVKAQHILASRGAELIMATQIEEAKAQALYEKEVMRSIREKMENLKSDDEETSKVWRRLLELPHHYQIIRNADKHLFNTIDDYPVSQCRTDDWKFKRAFIPDPLGDELERMNEINGVSAVFTRWMKGQPLYGSSGANSNNNGTPSPQNELLGESKVFQVTNGASEDDEAEPTAEGETIDTSPVNEGDVKGEQSLAADDEVHLESYDELVDEEATEGGRIRDCWDRVNLFVYSCLLSATVELNKLSRSYRYVSRRMDFEKNTLKKKFNLDDERFKTDPAWRKWVTSTLSDTYAEKNNEGYQGAQSNTSLHRIRSALKVMTSTAGSSSNSNQSVESGRSPPNGGSSSTKQRIELTDPEYHFLKLNMFTQFCRALAYVFISNTSLLCQLVIIFNQVLTASLLSLPLPLFTFLWGTLSVPRPTKRFWKTVITYTELVIVVKYVFQFPIWDWEPNNINPFYLPNLLGIKNITIAYDLLLLLVLFLHRSMLKSLGQWDASAQDLLDFVVNTSPANETNNSATKSITPQNTDPLQITTSNFQNHQKSLQNISPKSEARFIKSYELQENISDRAIELADRLTNSTTGFTTTTRIATTELDYLQESYQNQVQIIKIDEPLSTEMDDQAQAALKSSSRCYCFVRAYNRTRRSITLFFQHVLRTPHKVQTDVYTWMFLCDFINFLILIYGFWAFGSGYSNQTVASFLNENRIPFSVLIMLLAQFASIMIDRAFYLQKNIGSKLLFHIVLVAGIHIWLFFALPFTTGHTLTIKEYWPPKAWYVFKCIYFLLSAHQIRSGYPRHVLGNCFTKGFGQINWALFKVYRAIPLVYDLRLYMDWIWTETTLEFRDWAIMEDMFANLFIRKCELTIEEEYPTPRAKPINRFSKYITGGKFILLILAVIWGPLLLFSMGKTVGESNPPVEMEFELEFVGFQPILRLRATSQQITMLNEMQYDSLRSKYVSQNSQSFLGDYKVGDVAAIRIDGQSNAVWEISPPSKELLMNQIMNKVTLILKASWTLSRIKKEKSQNIDVNIAGSYTKNIDNSTVNDDFRTSLYDMLNSDTTQPTANTKFVITPPIFPNYLLVPETGVVSLVDQFSDNLPPGDYKPLRPLNLTYIRSFNTAINQTESSTSWWKAEDLCKYSQNNDTYSFWSQESLEHCNSLITIAFNNRIFTGLLALLSAPGIIGIYTTFVVFFARLIRTEPSGKVIYTEIPKVDRVYGLVMDIYMMRECGEFELEEKLFAKLLFLYRSPEMLIEWSKREDGLDIERDNIINNSNSNNQETD